MLLTLRLSQTGGVLTYPPWYFRTQAPSIHVLVSHGFCRKRKLNFQFTLSQSRQSKDTSRPSFQTYCTHSYNCYAKSFQWKTPCSHSIFVTYFFFFCLEISSLKGYLVWLLSKLKTIKLIPRLILMDIIVTLRSYPLFTGFVWKSWLLIVSCLICGVAQNAVKLLLIMDWILSFAPYSQLDFDVCVFFHIRHDGTC